MWIYLLINFYKIFDLLIDDFFDQDEKLQECEDKSGMIKICNLQRALITNCNEAMTILFQGLQVMTFIL